MHFIAAVIGTFYFMNHLLFLKNDICIGQNEVNTSIKFWHYEIVSLTFENFNIYCEKE